MTSKYRVEYALKSHRRDQFIEWVKGLLISPFVLFSQPAGDFEEVDAVFAANTAEVRRRYAEIMRDIEAMIEEHRALGMGTDGAVSAAGAGPAAAGRARPSRLKLLVPTVGPFFTALPLEAAFVYQDSRRHISSRRLVAPSFNDVRLTLNTAQMMALTARRGDGSGSGSGSGECGLQLVTFDGDLTLYEDGQNLEDDSPLIPRILGLLRRDVKVGIVTAAGYDTADRYYHRLHGLLDAIHAAPDLADAQKHSLLVVGGEASFVFAYSATSPCRLASVDPAVWMPDAMKQWPASEVTELLDLAETTLQACVQRLQLPAQVIRKARAVGIVPDAVETAAPPPKKAQAAAATATPASSVPEPPHLVQIARESLEEVVLTVHKRLMVSAAGRAGRVPFCAFNGGRDVFVDIGDKSWGVQICQHALLFLGGGARKGVDGVVDGVADGIVDGVADGVADGISFAQPATTLHVGDQFLSVGANDFWARGSATTAWVANPVETGALLDELLVLLG